MKKKNAQIACTHTHSEREENKLFVLCSLSNQMLLYDCIRNAKPDT